MKRLFITVGVIVAVGGASALYLIDQDNKTAKPPVVADVATPAGINNAIAPSAGVPAAATGAAPIVNLQQAHAPAGQNHAPAEAMAPETASSTAPAAAAPSSAPEKKVELSLADMNEIHAQVKESVEKDYADQVSFPLTEDRMIAFAQASLLVQKINNKWDVQIAGAETDAMAVEYSNFAVEEITKSLQSIQGLTLEQYNELSRLTATSQDFNRAYQVYKQLIQKEVIQVPPVPTKPVNGAAVPAAAGSTAAPSAAPVAPSSTAPSAPVQPVPTPPAAATLPAIQGTAPAPR